MKEEIWEDIPGFDGNYQVSTLGRVRSVDREVDVMSITRCGWYTKKCKGRILKIEKGDNGFNYVRLYLDGIKVKRQIQRLVAVTFLENPNDYDYVGFKDGNKDNMALENLEWTDEKRRCVGVLNEKTHVDHLSGRCPRCGEKLRNFGRVNYCWCCGQELRWAGVIV